MTKSTYSDVRVGISDTQGEVTEGTDPTFNVGVVGI
jgi:hypothetical protein